MKKLIFILALLLLAAPAWASVVVEPNSEPWETWVDEEDANLAWIEGPIEYNVIDSELVRAFALQIEVTGPNAVIDWVWFEGDAYAIAPGSEDGPIAEWVEDNIVIVEFASLYNLDAEDGVQPEPNGTLAGMSIIADAGSEEVCINITTDALRGGIVMEDVTTRALTNSEVCWGPLAEPEPECGDWLTEPQLAAWEGWITALEDAGLPPENVDNWCLECFGRGDIDADGFITFNDFSVAFQDFLGADNSTDPNAADSDVDMDGFITFNDASVVFQNFLGDVNCLDLDGYPLE